MNFYDSPKTCWVQRCLEFRFSFVLFVEVVEIPRFGYAIFAIRRSLGHVYCCTFNDHLDDELSISALEQLDFEIQQEFIGFMGVYGVYAGEF